MRIYADYAAAAPLRPEARAAMLETLDAGLGNPSSIHGAGARGRARIEAAREEIAALLHAHPLEIVLTSGATEANNLALAGAAAARSEPMHVAIAATDHASILGPAEALGASGHRLTLLPTDADGGVESGALPSDVDLVSIALVNAETGVIQPAAALTETARTRGAVVHTDAAQAASFLTLHVGALGVDLLTLSSVKVGGPAGAGALYVRRGVALAPLHRGGPQEHGLRAGTENVAAIAGFATALAVAAAERTREGARLAALATRLRAGIPTAWPGARLVPSAGASVAPHIVACTLPDAIGEDVVAALDLEGIACSSGSACAAGAAEPSHVLLAMGRGRDEARRGLRISLGWNTGANDVDGILTALARVRARVTARSEEAAWPAHGS
jgi:cysteine desulfurase